MLVHSDTLPLTLFGSAQPGLTAAQPARTYLDGDSWIDLTQGWLTGADTLFAELDKNMAWFRGRRLMYGTWHREPRLTATEPSGEAHQLPAVIDHIRDALSAHYQRAFMGLFCNYYTCGQDSVAWHADRIGRTTPDPLVAIVSLGGPRTLHLRPMHGGRSHQVVLASGDLLVMGGASQRQWEHAIPKVSMAAPRMSITMRAGRPDHRSSKEAAR